MTELVMLTKEGFTRCCRCKNAATGAILLCTLRSLENYIDSCLVIERSERKITVRKLAHIARIGNDNIAGCDVFERVLFRVAAYIENKLGIVCYLVILRRGTFPGYLRERDRGPRRYDACAF